MKVLFSGQVPKEPAFPDDIEDVLVITSDNSRIVICDGASESYDSKTWAKILASNFAKQEDFSLDWLNGVIAEYTACFDHANLSWSKQAAFERGSFATLLGLNQSPNSDRLQIISIGDSLAVFLDGDQMLESFPYVHAEDFQQRPELLCTNSLSNTFVTLVNFAANHQRTWSLEGRTAPAILCMTDALGEWALRHFEAGDSKWQQLAQIRDVTELQALVNHEREAKTLRVDDTTLINLSFSELEKDGLPVS